MRMPPKLVVEELIHAQQEQQQQQQQQQQLALLFVLLCADHRSMLGLGLVLQCLGQVGQKFCSHQGAVFRPPCQMYCRFCLLLVTSSAGTAAAVC
jgi:hypothetical protein